MPGWVFTSSRYSPSGSALVEPEIGPRHAAAAEHPVRRLRVGQRLLVQSLGASAPG